MRVKRQGVAGTQNKRDCSITVAKGDAITLHSNVKGMFGEHIETLITTRLSELDVKASVTIQENGALDYVILSRLESALSKACKETIPDTAVARKKKKGLRRSRMYVPGNNPRMLNNAGVYGCDCIILDLEDSVAEAHKTDARYLIKNALKHLDFTPSELWVRINKEMAQEDLNVIKYGAPHGICVPKVECKEDILYYERILKEKNMKSSLMPIIETAKGIEHISEIAEASDTIVALAFGAEDYTRDIGGKRSWDSLLYARSSLVVAAKAHGLQALDTIYPTVDDPEGLKEELHKIIEMGFDGKGVIHPNQIELVHECFMPTKEEIEHARQIVKAIEEAKKKGCGTASLNGQMIDVPVEKKARRILQMTTGER
jgi:citrate lyase subunit beta/citryl-CoA lyase